jgi:hypothetical protein
VLGAGSARAGSPAAQAHARKANSLAAAGKCKQAIPEYNAAYRLLKDPALLFNRAECLRKVGQGKLAVYDYRKFLEEMPSAPNRKLVESRIAALDPDAPRAAPTVETRAIVQAPLFETPAPAPAPPPAPAPALHAASLRMPLPAAEPPPPVVRAEPSPMVIAAPAPAPAPSSDSRAWIWLSVAAAVVAASAGGALYFAGKPRNQ